MLPHSVDGFQLRPASTHIQTQPPLYECQRCIMLHLPLLLCQPFKAQTFGIDISISDWRTGAHYRLEEQRDELNANVLLYPGDGEFRSLMQMRRVLYAPLLPYIMWASTVSRRHTEDRIKHKRIQGEIPFFCLVCEREKVCVKRIKCLGTKI